MKDSPNKDRLGKVKGKGCLVTCLVIIGLFAYAFWQIGVPSTHARQLYGAIHPGMSLEEIGNLLKGKNERHFELFQILQGTKWIEVSRDEFTQFVSTPTTSSISHARVQITFMGVAPNRVSFFVEFDGTGRVSNITKPYGWD